MAEQQSSDLVLTPGEFSFVLEYSKGTIAVCVGPHKSPIGQTESPMLWDNAVRRFMRSDLARSIQTFPNAPEGYYLVLENPAEPGPEEHPREGKEDRIPKLHFGQRVNIPGPTNFPLWPRQHAKVVPGHHLRSNQFLVVRVYNEMQANANWARAVVRPQRPASTQAPTPNAETGAESPTETTPAPASGPTQLMTMGQMLIIKGTEVSFYIPPTGIEVLPEDGERYVREAVTLEQLEYCILIGEDGEKRYVRGPAVVFPDPTERFVDHDGYRKFQAIELNEISGIHVKVIAPYTDELGQERRTGEELFITGSEQAIYFPRVEHVTISYGADQPIHYATAIPAGEARYVLNRLAGEVSLVRGPSMFLPDPRTQVLIRRALDDKTVELWFPESVRALEVNRALTEMQRSVRPGDPITQQAVERTTRATKGLRAETAGQFTTEEFQRKSTYTPPRILTLDTKYDGAICIEIWTGYAVLVTNRRGERRVVVGPTTILLEYDESLAPMELSTGKPKTTDKLLSTVYLRVSNNRVSDIVTVETRDFCRVNLKVSYLVNFEGDSARWFDVENYVKHLTDHGRSLLRNITRQYGVEDFYQKVSAIVRDTILGVPQGSQPRTGRIFTENGMRIYEVEILDAKIEDAKIAELLQKNQHDVVRATLEVGTQERELEMTKRAEAAKRGIAIEIARTHHEEISLRTQTVETQLQLDLRQLAASAEKEARQLSERLERQQTIGAIANAENERVVEAARVKAEAMRQEAKAALERLGKEAEIFVKRAAAINPDLVKALQAFQDTDSIERLAKAVSPLAILGGESIVEIVAQLFKGTPLEALARSFTDGNTGRQPALRS